MKKHLRTIKQRITFAVILAFLLALLVTMLTQLISGGDMVAVLYVALFILGVVALVVAVWKTLNWIGRGESEDRPF